MQPEIIDQIMFLHRQRCFAMEQRKRIDLALGSFLRMMLGWSPNKPEDERRRIAAEAQRIMREPSDSEWAHVVLASQVARAPFEKIEDEALKAMSRLAQSLPVWAAFAESVRGFGAGSLAVIIGEAGDLSNYASEAKLWKRMGLAVMDGVRQGGLRGGASKDDWIAHGYSPVRRSRMFVIGDVLVKVNKDGAYRAAYDRRKAFEREKAEAAGLTVAPAAKIPAKRNAEFISEGHIHLRAQRYMEKRLLRDLWRAWRKAEDRMSQRTRADVPSVHPLPAPQPASAELRV